MAKRRHGDKNHDQFRDSGSDVRSTFVSKPRMLQNRPTHGRANQRSMVPVRRIFFCNSMTP